MIPWESLSKSKASGCPIKIVLDSARDTTKLTNFIKHASCPPYCSSPKVQELMIMNICIISLKIFHPKNGVRTVKSA